MCDCFEQRCCSYENRTVLPSTLVLTFDRWAWTSVRWKLEIASSAPVGLKGGTRGKARIHPPTYVLINWMLCSKRAPLRWPLSKNINMEKGVMIEQQLRLTASLSSIILEIQTLEYNCQYWKYFLRGNAFVLFQSWRRIFQPRGPDGLWVLKDTQQFAFNLSVW